MKISTKGRYGLRAMVDLGVHGEKSAVSISSIAERQAISISYLEQLIAKLRKAGLVNSIRGSQGGYVLARPCSDISVGDVLRALEGNLNPVDCVELTGESECSGAGACVTKYVWQKINDSISDAVDNIMISELVADAKGVLSNQQYYRECEK